MMRLHPWASIQKPRTRSHPLTLERLEDRTVPADLSSDFVRSLYGHLLNRGASGDEVEAWVRVLDAGLDHGTLVARIWTSRESHGLMVDEFYRLFLKRLPAPAERNAWVGELQAGRSEAGAQLVFLTSEEYQVLHRDPDRFVEALYADVLGRTADPAGRTSWVNWLSSGSSWLSVASAFLTSSERTEVLLNQLYRDALGRRPEPAGRDAWLPRLQAGEITAVVGGVFGSAEFLGRAPGFRWTSETLVEPPVVASAQGVLQTTLVARSGSAVINGRPAAGTATYNGLFPGPTLSAQPGDTLRLTLRNDLADTTVPHLHGNPTNLHTHGLHVSPTGNGDNPFLEVRQGAQQDYTIPIPANHPQGLYWYHPHHHHFVEDQVFLGLAGLLVVGRPDGGAAELGGLKQRLLALRSVQLKADGTLAPTEQIRFATQQSTVNGQINPTLTLAPGEAQVWNFANISIDTYYTVQLQAHTFHVVAEDGQPYTQPHAKDSITLDPGKRYSVLVTAGVAGTYVLRTTRVKPTRFEALPEEQLATLVVQGRPQASTPPPAALTPPASDRRDLRAEPLAGTRHFVFSIMRPPERPPGERPDFTINGFVYPNVPLIEPRLNTVEEWVLLNDSNEAHPFHLHVNGFQVISVNDRPEAFRSQQDVVTIPPVQNNVPGKIVLRIRFADFTGRSVYHCHILPHADHGMMGVFNALP